MIHSWVNTKLFPSPPHPDDDNDEEEEEDDTHCLTKSSKNMALDAATKSTAVEYNFPIFASEERI